MLNSLVHQNQNMYIDFPFGFCVELSSLCSCSLLQAAPAYHAAKLIIKLINCVANGMIPY